MTMTTSSAIPIAIPRSKTNNANNNNNGNGNNGKQPHRHHHNQSVGSESSLSTPPHSSGSVGNTAPYGSFGSYASSSTPSGSLMDGAAGSSKKRRESLMSPVFSRAEHTVVDVGGEECPRLITCVKASQGFDWNQEIFLPSYADYHFDDLERRQDPVEDIILTEEEVKNMFPS